jgi:hypothetical protein
MATRFSENVTTQFAPEAIARQPVIAENCDLLSVNALTETNQKLIFVCEACSFKGLQQ